MNDEYLLDAKQKYRNARDYEKVANSLGLIYGGPILSLAARRYEQCAKSYLSARRLRDSRSAFLDAVRLYRLANNKEKEKIGQLRVDRLTKVLRSKWHGLEGIQ